MTREDAIKILKECRERKLKYTFYTLDEYQAATDIAIEALEQEPDAIHNEREQAYMKGYEDASKRYRTEPCEDAISRQEVLNIIEFEDKWLVDAKSHNTNTTIAFDSMISKVQALPSVSTEKTGHWIAQDIHNCHTDFRCSKCGYIHSFMHLYGEPTADYTYCPNCGAKMEVEE